MYLVLDISVFFSGNKLIISSIQGSNLLFHPCSELNSLEFVPMQVLSCMTGEESLTETKLLALKFFQGTNLFMKQLLLS